MTNYVVLDKHYSPEEGQEVYEGSFEECSIWKGDQCKYSKSNEFMLEIVPKYE